ncbi:solute carrier family 66 member 3 [Condylostylus longicornis]|uniref:solute carrier family 66 member 3 n=1 Tax=Condylostylus longicornis TaxID=2530218 RepID=UPI00244DB945|nr:solute carrier family 66 member 3 [Condylostylus longicornis]
MVDSYFDKGIALIFADFLSLITVSSCVYVKIPQIKTILQNKSAQGISVLGLCLELFSYSVMMSYNYTNDYQFLSYMEYPVLLAQEYVLIYVVFKYKNLLEKKFYYTALAYVVYAICVYFRLMPLVILSLLVPFCTPIGATSKVLQLIEILRTRDSTAVSLTTWALSAFTNFTRIYTVFVESGDMMLLTNFMISFLLSSSVYLAAYFFKKPKIV